MSTIALTHSFPQHQRSPPNSGLPPACSGRERAKPRPRGGSSLLQRGLGQRPQESRKEHYFIQLPEILRQALKDEDTLRSHIQPPENLLQNLFSGLEDPTPKPAIQACEGEDLTFEDGVSFVAEEEGQPVEAKQTTKSDTLSRSLPTMLLKKRPYQEFAKASLHEDKGESQPEYSQMGMKLRRPRFLLIDKDIAPQPLQTQKNLDQPACREFGVVFKLSQDGIVEENAQARALRGMRLDSTKSCAAKISHSMFQTELEGHNFQNLQKYEEQRLKPEPSPNHFDSALSANEGQPNRAQASPSMISDDSCFKVPRSVQRSQKPASGNPLGGFQQCAPHGLSGKYLGMIISKQQKSKLEDEAFDEAVPLQKFHSAVTPDGKAQRSKIMQTPQFGINDDDEESQASFVTNSLGRAPEKKWIRGPYKTKRLLKMKEKESLNLDIPSQISQTGGKKHQSTIQKAAIAKQILDKIEQKAQSAVSVSHSVSAHEGEEQEEFKPCNCSNSGCLKLYCECFKNNRYCGAQCRCSCCKNSAEHESQRLKAKEMILMRNPFAFISKIQKCRAGISDQMAQDADVITQGKLVLQELEASEKVDSPENPEETQQATAESKENQVRHLKGCNCRKGCNKKYCECFQQGVLCSDLCKCDNCKNCDESKHPRHHHSSPLYHQHFEFSGYSSQFYQPIVKSPPQALRDSAKTAACSTEVTPGTTPPTSQMPCQSMMMTRARVSMEGSSKFKEEVSKMRITRIEPK